MSMVVEITTMDLTTQGTSGKGGPRGELGQLAERKVEGEKEERGWRNLIELERKRGRPLNTL